MIRIESDRLVLKTLIPSDVSEKYVSWLNDPDINKYLESRFIVQSLENVKRFVDDCDLDKNTYLFGIYKKIDNQHIGNIKIGPILQHHKCTYVGILIGEKSEWGNGYASESIRCVTEWGFKELGLEKIEAGCYENNVASKAAFEKCGYKLEAILRKHFVCKDKRVDGYILGMLKNDLAI